ncbi:MAG: cobalamin biosynthesis protein CobD [Pseudonocardiales bacterium]|nr:cobalamin biosynthesis protein CobD [Pseudonocardiales bacterium]
MVKAGSARALGLAAGYALDAGFGDPRRGHPVALFGTLAERVERLTWADSRGRGVVFCATLVGSTVALGWLAERAKSGNARLMLVAVAAWTVLGGRGLRVEAEALAGLLAHEDLPAARERLTHLVGRDPSGLDEAEIARAAVESVAENTSDAVVAPLFWGALLGVPGLLGYRAINTLDAMVGHHSSRYERFGWASARLDDLSNLIPARLTALLTAAVAPVVGGSFRATRRVERRDGFRHPSPNSGHCEAAFAGALGIRLGGRNVYGDRVEERPVLGDGPVPGRADLSRAAQLSLGVGTAATLVCAAVAAMVGRRAAGAVR